MDTVTLAMIGGFTLLVLATLWNTLVAPKKRPVQPKGEIAALANQQGFSASDATMVYDGVVKGHDVRLRGEPPSAGIHVDNGHGLHMTIEHGHHAPAQAKQGLIDVPANREGITIRADYPLLVQQLVDDETLKRIADAPEAAFVLGDTTLTVTAAKPDRKTLQKLVNLGVDLAAALEELNGVDLR